MAEITLDRCWLHLADDLDTFVRFYTTGRSDANATGGEVRSYANGRRRLIVSTSSARTLGVTLRQVTDANLATLDTWRGVLLMLRDHRGRLVFGTFLTYDVADYKDRSGYDVTLTFEQVSHEIAA